MDPTYAADMQAAEAEICRILERGGAELVGIRSWDERRLAYQIGKFRRGLYMLTYFRAQPEKISSMERDVQLSEITLRALFIRRDKMTEEDIHKSLSVEPPKASNSEEHDNRGDRQRRNADCDRREDPRRVAPGDSNTSAENRTYIGGKGAGIDNPTKADLIVVWDPEAISSHDYARLIAAIGDLHRSEGATGIMRIGAAGFGLPVESGVFA